MTVTRVLVTTEDFDVTSELASLRASCTAGAQVAFVGVVRNRNEGSDVLAIEIQHYPGMTEKAIASIIGKARAKWVIEDAVVIHRVGRLALGEQIVLCLVTAAHRGEAFEACEYIMDWLKTEAPFWKREETPSGMRWVDARESDEAARGRWK